MLKLSIKSEHKDLFLMLKRQLMAHFPNKYNDIKDMNLIITKTSEGEKYKITSSHPKLKEINFSYQLNIKKRHPELVFHVVKEPQPIEPVNQTPLIPDVPTVIDKDPPRKKCTIKNTGSTPIYRRLIQSQLTLFKRNSDNKCTICGGRGTEVDHVIRFVTLKKDYIWEYGLNDWTDEERLNWRTYHENRAILRLVCSKCR